MTRTRALIPPALAVVGVVGLVALFALAPSGMVILGVVPVLLFTYGAARSATGGRPLVRRRYDPAGRWSYLVRPAGDVAAFGEQLRPSDVRYRAGGIRGA